MFTGMLFSLAAIAGAALAQSGNPAITTGQYNNGRTSANTSEAILNTSNVNVNQFGKLFSWSVDGQVYAQPLYVPGVTIGGTTTNVVYIATMHNNVYAFDAENPGAPPLWQANLGQYVANPNSNGSSCPSDNTSGELGILSTPVIDLSSNTMYVMAVNPVSGGLAYYLHALDITTGADNQSPVLVQPSVSGNGYDSQNGIVQLTPGTAVSQRTALLLANGTVYAGFGSCGGDSDPYHGWLVGYSASNLQNQQAVFNSTPNSGQGGIWQSGRGFTADSSGNIYLTTGNATDHSGWPDVTTGSASGDAAQGDYPMRFIQLSSAGQFLASYPPPKYPTLNSEDLDFSSSGPLQIPGTNLVIAGGKDGIVYVFNPSNLATPVQSFQATGGSACADTSFDGCDQIHDLAFWNSRLYVWGSWDVLRVYNFSNSTKRFATTPSSKNSISTPYHPASLAVSSNGTQAGTGIVWAITPTNGSTPAMLHAFNASNVATELWNSNMNPGRDALPSYPKFTEPTVANGRVYVATHSNQIAVYGLLQDFSLSTSTSSTTAYQGNSTQFTITVNAVSGFQDPVAFSISGLPSGATATFAPTFVNGSGSTTVTVSTSSSTPTGTYNLIVSGNGDGLTSTASLSLIVTTPDTTPPQWSCCTYTFNPDGSYTMTYSAWDTQSGLQSIQATEVVDATVSIPNFPVGTNSTVQFTATESGWSSYVQFQIEDVAGNISTIDPITINVDRQPGKPTATPTPAGIKFIPPELGFVTIVNGIGGLPGLTNLRIDIVAGTDIGHVEVAGLHDGEIRTVDIRSSLPPAGAPVELIPLGKPGGTALVMFATSPMAGGQQ